MAATQQQAEVRRRNPRGQGDRLREEIISAASELIAESGDADRLSLRSVAKRIGIAAPSIYRHFPDAKPPEDGGGPTKLRHLRGSPRQGQREDHRSGRGAAGPVPRLLPVRHG